jgi:hypothetical protein
MKNEFIPYQQALSLKELGFNEPCFGYYIGLGDNKETPFKLIQIQSEKEQFNWVDNVCHAPLYQQAFRWFREKYRLYPIIDSFVGVKGVVKFFYKLPMYNETFNIYEEAEQACLDKLIEICKNK